MSGIIKVVLLAILIMLITQFVPGVAVNAFWPTAVVAGIVLAFLNNTIKPILNILAIPISIITFGLIGLVINAFLFWAIGPILGWIGGLVGVSMTFTVSTWVGALIGGIIASLGVWVLNEIVD